MSTPASGAFTTGVQTSLAPWLTPQADPGGHFTHLTTALAAMFEPVGEIVMDTGSPDDPAGYVAGWSILLDPDNCPAQFLPFCAMFNGTTVAPGTDATEARAIIKAEAGFGRGTPAAIVATAQRFLTGTKSCVLLERTPDPYSAQLVMRPEECPDRTVLENAVLAVKPAGIVLTFVFTDGWTIFQMEAAYGSITALEAAFTTVNGLEQDQVGH